MKKVIDRILQDDTYFNRKRGVLTFSVPQIEGEVKYGDTLQGSFEILADKAYQPEGYIYSHDLRMSVSRQQFGGLVQEIFYQYDARGLAHGSIMEGSLSVVSNLGEYELPYRIVVSNDVPDSTLGEIRNLFHFTNLAKSNWDEAVDLFYSAGFSEILGHSEDVYRSIYKSLAEGGVNEQNVENFLVLTKKKNRITYDCDVKKVEMDLPDESVWLSCKIRREGWGYSRLNVRTEGEFLFLQKDLLTSGDFDKNISELDYGIDREKLYPGDNRGKILLEDMYNRIEIPVVVHCTNHLMHTVSEKKKNTAALMKLYMDFRLGKKNRQKWTKESMAIIHRMLKADANDLAARLYQVQILIVEGREEEALQILERLRIMIENEDAREDVLPQMEGYYYYLSSLCARSDEEIYYLAKKVEHLYSANADNWRLAWMVLYLRTEFADHDMKKWAFLRKQYEFGVMSPVMLLEAYQIMLRSPSVMTELTGFELALLRFVSRRGLFQKEIRSRFVFLVPKIKVFSEEILDLLTDCYRMEEKNETLTEICLHLMKGNKIGKEYFDWYSRAVDQELRITRLYEYYIMSIDVRYEGRLPKMILMYFAYHSNLDYERSAFLYANVLKHRQDYKDIYQEYYPAMEEFAREQLLKGHINDDLAYLYERLLKERMTEPEYAAAYLDLCFQARIKTKCKNVVSVVTVNDMLRQDVTYPVYQGEAVICLPGTDYAIGLEDEDGNRYFDDSLYEVEYLLQNREDMKKTINYADVSLYSALYQARCYGRKITVTPENEQNLLWLSEQEEITEEFGLELMLVLLEYYFDADEIFQIDQLLPRFDPSRLSGQQRETCIHIMVARGMYEESMDWIRTYGTEYINYKILLRLCDRVLIRSDYEYEPEVLKICLDIFRQGKYDESLLNYLLKYAKGSSRFLKDLWRAAESFELDVHDLLELMLVQILYSGERIGEETNIYQEYVEYGANPRLEKAFLALLAYKYFNKQEKIDERVFDRVISLRQMNEEVPLGCKLAYLRKTADIMKRGRLFDAEKALIPVFIKEMAAHQIFFPFFMDFKHLAPQLNMMSDRCFIEYHGSEGSKVVLHYVTEPENDLRREYKKEEMPHMYAGIYVKSFILFEGETIQYYITEEDGRQEKLTRSSVLVREEAPDEKDGSRFAMINRLTVCQKQQDYEAYCRDAEEYARKSYLVRHLFHLYQTP